MRGQEESVATASAGIIRVAFFGGMDYDAAGKDENENREW
jgi:hypothetical protein